MLDPNLSRTIKQIIEVLAVRLTVPGFGIPLILVAGAPVSEPDVTSYSGLTEIVEAGYSTDHLLYKKASVIFAQNPHPERLFVAKRSANWTKKYTLKIGTLVENEQVFLRLGTAPRFVYTADATPTAAEAATALAAAITTATAQAGFTAAAVTDTVTITANAPNTLPLVGGLSKNVQITDVTVDPGIDADLAALLEDPSINEWYGLLCDSYGATEFDKLASFAQSNGKFAGLNSCDSGIGIPSVTDDVFSIAKGKTQTRAMGFAQDLFFKTNVTNQDFIAEGVMAAVFPLDAGSETWKFKNASNVTAGKSKSSYINAVHAKNGNTFSPVQGANIVEQGMMLGGEWADVVRGVDWLEVEIAIAVFGFMAAQRKVGFSDLGIDSVVAQIRGALERGENRGLLVKGSSRIVAPRRVQVSQADRIARKLTGVKWNADLEGAIHFADVQGAISP